MVEERAISISSLATEAFLSLRVNARIEFVALGLGFFLSNLLDLGGALALGALVAMGLGSEDVTEAVEQFGGFVGFSGSSFALVTGIIVALFGLKIGFSIFVAFRYTRFLRALEASGHARIVDYFLSGDLTRLLAATRAETVWAIGSSASVIYGIVLGALVFLVADVLSAIVTFAILVAFDPVAAAVISGYFLGVGFLYQLIVRPRIAQVSLDLIESSIAVVKWSHDLIEGFRELVVSNHSRRYAALFERTRAQALRAITAERMLGIFPRLFVELSLIFGVVAVVFWLYQSGGLVDNLVVLAVFIAGGLRLIGALLPIQTRVASLLAATDQARKALDWQKLAGQAAHISLPRDALPGSVETLKISLAFRNVTFAYGEGTPVVSDVSFSIVGPGLISISGPSGAGKTTIRNLGLGLLRPHSGEVRLIGRDPVVVREQNDIPIAVAPQRMVAFSGTIAQNIALGVPDGKVDHERIAWLLERLDIFDPVMALPKALETELVGHFDFLSGGQFQRLALARAFYPRPRFVVLDESTNALDEASKRLVLNFIREQAEDCLVLAINHDRDFKKVSDGVLHFHNGRLESTSKW